MAAAKFPAPREKKILRRDAAPSLIFAMRMGCRFGALGAASGTILKTPSFGRRSTSFAALQSASLKAASFLIVSNFLAASAASGLAAPFGEGGSPASSRGGLSPGFQTGLGVA